MNMHFHKRASLVAHVARFTRRMARHGIETTVCGYLDEGHSCCKVSIGVRRVSVFNDGTSTRSLTRTDDHFDGRAFLAQSHRMHAVSLTLAGEDRKLGFIAQAREHIKQATHERKCHERARTRR